MEERLTMRQIMEKYPDQWVGLDEIDWRSPTSSNINSAIVRYTGKTSSELTELQIRTDGRIVAFYTSPDSVFQLGTIGVP